MRENRLLKMFGEGRLAVGATPPFVSPEAVEFMGIVGFDFVFLDAEHDAIGPETCQALVRAAELTGIEPLVRVPANNPQTILSYLETGALTVQIPHVNTAEEAHLAVQAVKYPPLGIRGARQQQPRRRLRAAARLGRLLRGGKPADAGDPDGRGDPGRRERG